MHRLLLAGTVAAIALTWAMAAALPSPIEIRLDAGKGVVKVSGINPVTARILRTGPPSDAEWAAILAVRPSAADASAPAMLGDWSAAGGGVVFRPRFPFVAGMPYTVTWNESAAGPRWLRPVQHAAVTARVMLPRRSAPVTFVTAIHPSAAEVPANLLKFHVTFSRPMSVGEALRRVHLLDDEGREVPRAFLRLDEELWNADRTRVTLILDPGRIKRGLRANLEEGAPLKAGHRYRMVVDRDWADGDGNPLGATMEKTFRVTAADRAVPAAAKWNVTEPRSGTREPLRIGFPEPLDYALLLDGIMVIGLDGSPVGGRVEVAPGDAEWRFVPERPWPDRRFAIQVTPELEDLAGNDLDAPFDVDLRASFERRARPAVAIGFATRPCGETGSPRGECQP